MMMTGTFRAMMHDVRNKRKLYSIAFPLLISTSLGERKVRMTSAGLTLLALALRSAPGLALLSVCDDKETAQPPHPPCRPPKYDIFTFSVSPKQGSNPFET